MSLPAPRRSHPVLFVLMGLLILGASAWVFLLIMKSVYGRFEVADILPTAQNLRAALSRPRAAVLESHYSEQLMPEGSMWIRDNVGTWERFLAGSRWEYD